jgi:hypothetical protein
MKDAPRLSGFTAPESARADFASKPAEPPTGGRPQRPGKASSVGAWTGPLGGPWTGLLRGRLTFHTLRVARSAMEQLTWL